MNKSKLFNETNLFWVLLTIFNVCFLLLVLKSNVLSTLAKLSVTAYYFLLFIEIREIFKRIKDSLIFPNIFAFTFTL